MSCGTIDMNIKTGTVLAETVTVIVYATYSSDIIIEEGCSVDNILNMWDYEIERLLHSNYTFIGCYPNDKLPQIEKNLI